MRIVAILLVLITIGAAPPASADAVDDALKTAKRLYGDGEYARAIRELRFAILEIEKKVGTGYVSTFPEPPRGWEAARARHEGARGTAALVTGQMITRRYLQKGGDGRVEAQLIVDNPMMQALAAMFANPGIAAAAGFERLRVPGVRDDALVKHTQGSGEGEAFLMVSARAFIKLSGEKLESAEVMKELLRTWQYQRLAKVMGRR